MVVTAFPFLWRYVNGLPSFSNEHQKQLELVMILPKFVYYWLNFVLLMLTKSVAHKKMHLKQMFMTMIEPATVLHSSL